MKLSTLNSQISILNSKRGFTLIELLVVFTVIAILAGIGVASMVTYSRSQQVNQAANDIKLVIGQAKFNALSSVKKNTTDQGSTVDCGEESLSGYSVTLIGNSSIDLNQVCSDESVTRIKRSNLPQNLTFDVSTTCTQIFFNALSSFGTGLPCQFVITGYGQTKLISIDATGNVSIDSQ